MFDPSGHPRRMVAGAALAVVAAFVVVVVALGGEQDDFAAARARVDDDQSWQTATESAENLAGVADMLLALAAREGCEPDPAPTTRCAGIHRSAAWAQIAAVGALRCTQPYVIDIRRDLADLLDALADGGTGLSSPPPRPVC